MRLRDKLFNHNLKLSKLSPEQIRRAINYLQPNLQLTTNNLPLTTNIRTKKVFASNPQVFQSIDLIHN